MEFDWASWQPKECATLLFVVRDGQILLIRKKRGLGAGKINGPGGRIEPGRHRLTPPCARRARNSASRLFPRSCEANFIFSLSMAIACIAVSFVSEDFVGEPVETPEAIPLWTPLNAIPYEEMWADDICWLPDVLAGGKVRGFFHFEHERLLSHQVVVEVS